MTGNANFFCISTYFKGQDFLIACKEAGNRVFLLTRKSLEHEPWPRAYLDDIFFIESEDNSPENLQNIALGLAHFMRGTRIDRLVALDDFDVEKAAYLREEFRIPGMGQTTARHFRDKLAMRLQAADAGLRVPPFTPIFNDDAINQYAESVTPPWVIKPRGEASAVGIRKIDSRDALWPAIHQLEENRYRYLIEAFKPGDVYHVDTLCFDGKVVFSRSSKYLSTPFEVAHGGGIFRSHTLPFESDEDEALRLFNEQVLLAFGLRFGASHTEFIRSHEDGQFYFLETSSRVGGAHLAEMVEYSSGINLWREWARIEDAQVKQIPYRLPEVRYDYTGILMSLSRFQHPDYTGFNDPEIVWTSQKEHHVGMIVKSNTQARVLDLLDQYAERVGRDFHASAPPKEKPTN